MVNNPTPHPGPTQRAGRSIAPSNKKSTATHTKRLARRYAAHSGLTYIKARALVLAAAELNLLPTPLDERGMDAALGVLDRYRAATTPGAIPSALTPGRPASIDLTNAPAAPNGSRQGIAAATSDPLYLIPTFLRVLRKAWQGRMYWESRAPRATTAPTIVCDSRPLSVENDVIAALLIRDGYLRPSPRFLGAGEWEKVEVTDLGYATLGQCGALADPYFDGLPPGTYQSAEHRRPYVGHGVDGALRCAEIDRTEIDHLNLADPREAEHAAYLRTSIQRWEHQASDLLQAEWAAQLAADRTAAKVFSDLAGTSSANPIDSTTSAQWDHLVADPQWLTGSLARCHPATPALIRHIGETLASSGLVTTDWHTTSHLSVDDSTSDPNGDIHRESVPGTVRLVRTTWPSLTPDHDLVLVDSEQETSHENFDWSEEPEKAARHHIHPDGRGITFRTPQGKPDRTHRIAAPGTPVTRMPRLKRHQ